MGGCVVEIGNGLEMRAMSVGLQEEMIKIDYDCLRSVLTSTSCPASVSA